MSKFKGKNSPMKLVGIVFLVITLIIAVSLTNNTVRKFIFGSEASGTCDDLGSAAAKNACKQEVKYAVDKANKNYAGIETFRGVILNFAARDAINQVKRLVRQNKRE